MFSGHFSLQVLGASDLPSKYQTLNTYVQVKVDDSEIFKTKTSQDSLNPVWNETKEFDMKGASQISFKILDEKEKELIGECLISLESILVEQIGREELKLTESLTPQGELQFEIWLKEDEETRELKRRDAVEKIYRVRGHNFSKEFFSQPTFCAQDQEFIWGMGKQGMRCSGCKITVHKRCHKLVLNHCPAAAQQEGEGGGYLAERKHDFVKNTYLAPTFCDHDGTMLYGLLNQGYRCKACSINVHKSCRDLVPATCGVDKLALALITVQRESVRERSNSTFEKNEEEMKKLVASKIEKFMKSTEKHEDETEPIPEENAEQKKETKKSKLDDFHLMKTLGEGAFGKVMLAKHIQESNYYAIKILGKPEIALHEEFQLAFLERDVLAMGSKSRFLTSLHSSFQTADHIFLVMEYQNGGDLMYHMMQEGRFPEERSRFYTAELVLAFLFLHSNGIIYRDLKLENVMLTAKGHVKLADFGMIKENMNNGATTNTFCGTPTYLAPELLTGLPYGASVDWWSLGVLLYQMMAGRSPFDHDDDEMLYKLIQYRQVLIPSSFSQEAQYIIKALLQKNPDNRLGCKADIGQEEVKGVSFFESIPWEDLERGKVEPPFQPTVGNAEDTNNFDIQFTDQPTDLPKLKMDKDMKKLAEEGLRGFSFYNADFDN